MAQVFSPFTTSRMPPQNIEAEISLLGSVLLDGSMMDKIIDIIGSDDFYKKEHKTIFEAIESVFAKSEPVDIIAVGNRLKEKSKFEDIGGNAYLTTLVNSVPTSSNAVYYAEIVRKKKILRDLISVSHEISQLGYQEQDDVDVLLDDAEKRLFSIANQSLIKGFLPIKSDISEAWSRIENSEKGVLRGLSTGFAKLDDKLSGLQKSDLIILAARPSLGKTSLALDIARHIALNENIPVGLFSLEMARQQIIDRLIAAEARVDSWSLKNGRLSPESDDFERIRDAIDRLSRAPLYVDDEVSINVLQMRAKARRLQAEHGLGLVVVDYLQLMLPRTQSDSMVQQITEISRSLKGLARELNVPVLALSQLNRSIEHRNDKKPQLADLRDSGAIEQDADVVMFIHREDRFKENSDRQNQADILIRKHRNGPIGDVTLYFHQEFTSFSSLEDAM